MSDRTSTPARRRADGWRPAHDLLASDDDDDQQPLWHAQALLVETALTGKRPKVSTGIKPRSDRRS